MRKSFQLRASASPSALAGPHVGTGKRTASPAPPSAESPIIDSQNENSALLKAAGNAWSDAFVILDASNHVRLSNQRFTDFFGIPASHILSASTDRLRTCLEPCMKFKEALDADWLAVEKCSPARTVLEWEIIKPSHRIMELTVSSLPDAIEQGQSARVLIWQDITQKKHRQASLQQAQRMEVVGTMAAGIAHDFNNILTAINGNITLALDQLAEGDIAEASSLLGIVMEAAAGGRDLVKKLLSHVRQNATVSRFMDMRTVVSDVQGLLKHTISPLIMVELRMPSNLWPVAGDANSIKQVIMNLCVNAVDAMKGRPNYLSG